MSRYVDISPYEKCRIVSNPEDSGFPVSELPTVDAVPVRHGHWIDAYPDIEPNPMLMYGICSVCGFEQSISNKLIYCPNCGAKMDEVSDVQMD